MEMELSMRVQVRQAELVRRRSVGVGLRMDMQPLLRRVGSMHDLRRAAMVQGALAELGALVDEAANGRASRMTLSRVGEWSYF